MKKYKYRHTHFYQNFKNPNSAKTRLSYFNLKHFPGGGPPFCWAEFHTPSDRGAKAVYPKPGPAGRTTDLYERTIFS